MISFLIAGLAIFGIFVCGLCVRTVITFVTVREDRVKDSALIPVAWVAGLALIGIVVIICVAMGYLGLGP